MIQRSFVTYLLLSLITCGIYGIYFWYMWTEDINEICAGDGQESPNYIVVFLLSIVTCGIYRVYWFYKQAGRLCKAAPQFGVEFKENESFILLWMVLGIVTSGVCTFIGEYFMISNTNEIAMRYTRN